jgi:hypothetical protein
MGQLAVHQSYMGALSSSPSLRVLAKMIQAGQESPLVRATAIKITRECGSRDDECELHALFDAVKHGDPEIPALADGFRYIADPNTIDFFTGAERTLKMCEQRACAGDCDDHTVLIGSLAGSLGFKIGVRGYGPSKSGPLIHVYAVALLPKRIKGSAKVMGMDTTVPESNLGWQPPPGNYKTAWVPGGI